MSHINRSPWIVAALALVAGSTQAEVTRVAGVTTTPSQTQTLELPIDPAGLPAECQQFLSVLPGARSDIMPWYQRLSIASCRQRVEVGPVNRPQQLGPMVQTIEKAMEPSIAIYNDAAARGPREIKILAEYGLGMTYLDTVVRARRAIDAGVAFGGKTYGGYKDGILGLHRAAEALLAHDLQAALDAFREVDRRADADSQSAHANEVVTTAVATARAYVAMLQP